jgi:hypothetical protein
MSVSDIRWWHIVLGVPALITIVGKLYFALNYPTATLRYRLELTAIVDGKPLTGAGVIEVSYRRNPQFLPDMQPVAAAAYGQAVMLDLGLSGMLFAVLESQFSDGVRADHLISSAWWNENYSPKPERFEQLSALRGKKNLRFDQLPLLVKFATPSRPLTAEVVDPHNLAASFGPGVELQSASIEIVDAPVTTGIEKRLPWLDDKTAPQKLFETSRGEYGSSVPLISQLQVSAFKKVNP